MTETRIVRSWRGHKAQVERAVSRGDHAAVQSHLRAVRDLEAIMLPGEREAAGLPPRAVRT